jgi:hypothetical protein
VITHRLHQWSMSIQHQRMLRLYKCVYKYFKRYNLAFRSYSVPLLDPVGSGTHGGSVQVQVCLPVPLLVGFIQMRKSVLLVSSVGSVCKFRNKHPHDTTTMLFPGLIIPVLVQMQSNSVSPNKPVWGQKLGSRGILIAYACMHSPQSPQTLPVPWTT